MIAVVLLSAPALTTSTPAGEKLYDDRAMIDRALDATARLGHLVPQPMHALTRAGDFGTKAFLDQQGELLAVRAAVNGALRLEGQPEAIAAHRTDTAGAVSGLARRIRAYDRSVDSFVLSWHRVLQLRKSRPAYAPSSGSFREWHVLYKASIDRYNLRRGEVKRAYAAFTAASKRLFEELHRVRLAVRALYAKDVVKPMPFPAVEAEPEGSNPPAPGREGPAPGSDESAAGRTGHERAESEGSARAKGGGDDPDAPGPVTVAANGAYCGKARALVAMSACTAADLRKAVGAGDRAFLEELEGTVVVLRTLLLEPAKEGAVRVAARLHAGGGEIRGEFPPASEVVAVRPGKPLVVAGGPREVEGGWVFHVSQWRTVQDLDRGKPMVLCKWPKGGTK